MRRFILICIPVAIFIVWYAQRPEQPINKYDLPANVIPFDEDINVPVSYERSGQPYHTLLLAEDKDGNYLRIALIHRKARKGFLGGIEYEARYYYEHSFLYAAPLVKSYDGEDGTPAIQYRRHINKIHLPKLKENSRPYRILIRKPDGPWHLLKKVSYGDDLKKVHVPDLQDLPRLSEKEQWALFLTTEFPVIAPILDSSGKIDKTTHLGKIDFDDSVITYYSANRIPLEFDASGQLYDLLRVVSAQGNSYKLVGTRFYMSTDFKLDNNNYEVFCHYLPWLAGRINDSQTINDRYSLPVVEEPLGPYKVLVKKHDEDNWHVLAEATSNKIIDSLHIPKELDTFPKLSEKQNKQVNQLISKLKPQK